MKKRRVHELSHDLNLTNKQLLYLIKHYTNIKVKSHMSSIDDVSITKIINAASIHGDKIKESIGYKEGKYSSSENQPLKFVFDVNRIIEVLNEVSKNSANYSGQILEIDRHTYDKNLEIITSYYARGKLVLVLGAGVSLEHNLPSWNELLQNLLLQSIVSDKSQTIEVANILTNVLSSEFLPNPLIAGRYLNNKFASCSESLAFEKAVRKTVYSNIDMSIESELFKEIRELCITNGKSSKLDSIITYNYDDLLEYYLLKSHDYIPYTSIFAPGMKEIDSSLPIYHVHGFLPRNGDLDTNNSITLSEYIYHEQYSDTYGWNNLVQINKFKDFNCLFIGTSFYDPNLRRLLDISMKLRGNNGIVHYCIKKRYNSEDVKKNFKVYLEERKDLLVDSIKDTFDLDEATKSLIDIIEDYEISDAQSFGVDIVWVDDYDEIPEKLRQIRT